MVSGRGRVGRHSASIRAHAAGRSRPTLRRRGGSVSTLPARGRAAPRRAGRRGSGRGATAAPGRRASPSRSRSAPSGSRAARWPSRMRRYDAVRGSWPRPTARPSGVRAATAAGSTGAASTSSRAGGDQRARRRSASRRWSTRCRGARRRPRSPRTRGRPARPAPTTCARRSPGHSPAARPTLRWIGVERGRAPRPVRLGDRVVGEAGLAVEVGEPDHRAARRRRRGRARQSDELRRRLPGPSYDAGRGRPATSNRRQQATIALRGSPSVEQRPLLGGVLLDRRGDPLPGVEHLELDLLGRGAAAGGPRLPAPPGAASTSR